MLILNVCFSQLTKAIFLGGSGLSSIVLCVYSRATVVAIVGGCILIEEGFCVYSRATVVGGCIDRGGQKFDKGNYL